MKGFFLFLVAYTIGHSYAQLASFSENRHDTTLDKRIRKVVLNDNQYLNTDNKNVIALFNVISDKSIENKDSLLHASRHIYEDILTTLGKSVENEIIDIIYWGKETDKDNISFSYSNNQYRGQAIYHYQVDTLLAPDSSVRKRLDRLSYNKYVRHEYDRNGLLIIFYVILKDFTLLNQKMAETDAIKFLIKYLDVQYRSYNQIKIFYIDQFTGSMTRYTVNVSDLILNNLANYLEIRKK
jgi:hypothetical protein